MTFKEIIQNDCLGLFCNLDEYGEKHRWDAITITCVIDDDSLMREYSSEFELLPKGSHHVFIPASELPARPQAGSVVRFDGVIYTVDEVRDEMGMYVVFLGRGRN